MSNRTVPAAPSIGASPAVIDATVATYLETWNETDPVRRAAG